MWECGNVYSSKVIWLRTSKLGESDQLQTWSVVPTDKERDRMWEYWFKQGCMAEDFWIKMIRGKNKQKNLRHRYDNIKWRQWSETNLPVILIGELSHYRCHFQEHQPGLCSQGEPQTRRVQEIADLCKPMEQSTGGRGNKEEGDRLKRV